jgi:RimJ/RimL family protein N-acetyltransferase
MENVSKSSRLVYRAIEDNEADRKFFHDQICMDQVSFALSDLRLQRPQSKKDSEGLLSKLASAMIAVMICLPPEKSDATDRDATATTTKDGSLTSMEIKSESSEPTPIGFTFLVGYPSPAFHQHRSASLGIALARPYHAKGYGPEALNWILDWAFIHGNLHTVNLRCFAHNRAAVQAYEKVGFVREGRLRETIWLNRQWHDEFIYNMLESEWEALRKQKKSD